MTWKDIVWGQFGASIDMLENAIRACPEPPWSGTDGAAAFWYVALHTLYFLDVYLDESEEAQVLPAPFARDADEPGGIPAERPYPRELIAWAKLDGLRLPERPYTQAQILGYLAHGRDKCRSVIAAMTDAEAQAPGGFPWLGLSRAELLLYNMRHVQHHAAQLNLLLRQGMNSAPAWVARTPTPVSGG